MTLEELKEKNYGKRGIKERENLEEGYVRFKNELMDNSSDIAREELEKSDE